MSEHFKAIKSLILLISFTLLASCGDNGDGKVSRGHRDAIKQECRDTSDVKACGLEVRTNFIDDGNDYVSLGELDKDQKRKVDKITYTEVTGNPIGEDAGEASYLRGRVSGGGKGNIIKSDSITLTPNVFS